MKQTCIAFLFILSFFTSNAFDTTAIKNNNKIFVLLRVTPSNYFLEDPLSVYQFGAEARYKKYGLSVEYGLQSRKINMPDVNRYYNRYYSVRSEFRWYRNYDKKHLERKYMALEYFYREHFSNYHYIQFDKKIPDYPYVAEYAYYDLKMSYHTHGITLKQGKNFAFNRFEVDGFWGMGLKYVKAKIISKRGSDETNTTGTLHVFYQNLGYRNYEGIKLNFSIGFKLAYNIYSFRPKNNSILNRI